MGVDRALRAKGTSLGVIEGFRRRRGVVRFTYWGPQRRSGLSRVTQAARGIQPEFRPSHHGLCPHLRRPTLVCTQTRDRLPPALGASFISD